MAFQEEAYKRFLNSAVTVAKRMAERDYGLVNIADTLTKLSLQHGNVFTSTPSPQDVSAMQGHHVKIGAAGELFVSAISINYIPFDVIRVGRSNTGYSPVFVLLSSLDPGLPSFGRDNWQSTIR